jgi:ribulose-5-phosphate 4-epimerase/fuculose-1-phosphate aldolase
MKMNPRQDRRPQRQECGDEEWVLRQDVAAAFRLLDKYGMSDLTNGSVVARLPGEENWFLTHPHGLFFHETKASDLIRIDMEGTAIDNPETPTNFAVCRPAAAIFRARPDVNAVIHAHGNGVMAVAALKCGLLNMLTEAHIPFYNDLAYIEADFYFGEAYCAEIAQKLGRHKALIYRHHAFASVGSTVSEAFFYAYSLNIACDLQMKILASHETYVVPPPEICQRHYDAAYGGDWRADGSVEWPGLRRMLDAEDPSYAN